MSWDPIHNFLDMVCSGGGKKARERWKKIEQRDRDVRAKRHIVNDPNTGWNRDGAYIINPNADGSINFEHTVEARDDSVKNFRGNIGSGVMPQVGGLIPGYLSAQEISQDLSEQARALGAMARNNSRGWIQRSPPPPMPRMPPPRFGPRFGSRNQGSQGDCRTATPPYLAEDPLFRPGFETSHERTRNLRSTDSSREPRSRRSPRGSELNSRQPVSSSQTHQSRSRSTPRENPRSHSRFYSTRISESESRSRPRQTDEPSHIPVSQVSTSSTLRVRTSQAPLGDMSRTFVEGMVPIEEEERPRHPHRL